MGRIKQSEILWIVRGIRLGRMLKHCARAVRRQLERFHRLAGTETADESHLRTSGRRMPSADTGADLPLRLGTIGELGVLKGNSAAETNPASTVGSRRGAR